MKFFLNHVEGHLVEVPFNWHSWHLSDCITRGYKFTSDGNKPVTITALLCDSYRGAIEVAKVNSLPYLPTARWSLSGELLYVVESEDEKKVSDILSIFAGKE